MALTIYKKGFKMGKVEILTLIAGVVLSIALALIVVPIFSSAGDMTKRTQIKYEVVSLIKHKELWEADKELNNGLDFNQSYKNYTKDVELVDVGAEKYIEFKSKNKCKVTADSTYFEIDCKIGSTNELKSYDDLITDLTQIAYDKEFIGSSDPVDKKIKIGN